MPSVIPYAETTWVDNTTDANAAHMNQIEQGIEDAHLMPAVRVFHNAAQSITTGTVTALAFNSERFDTVGGVASNMHDTVTNNSRLTCRYAGVYQITGMVAWAVNATGFRQAQIRLNGTTIIGSRDEIAASASFGTEMQVTSLYQLAVNDFVELVVQQTSGGALNVNSSANYSPEFMMVRSA